MSPAVLDSAQRAVALSPPFAFGGPSLGGVIRATPADFFVEEVLDITLDGAGEHLWLELEKCCENTEWLARQLANVYRVPVRDVGYAGLKDRQAVTRQWFSILTPLEGDVFEQAGFESVRLLQAKRHARKLRRGAHTANRFRIRLRRVEGDWSALADRQQKLAAMGVPNYFTDQRFGWEGRNIERALQWLLAGGRGRRSEQSRHYSVARSVIFNVALASRVEEGSWLLPRVGDRAMLDGSRSLFTVSEPELESARQRLAEGDIHLTGPLWGDGAPGSEGEVATQESAAARVCEPLAGALAGRRLEADRRALRVLVRDFQVEAQPALAELCLSFTLPPGAYALGVLREMVDYREERDR